MSDDLLKRLEFGSLTTMGSHKLNLEAAARIRELEAELATLREVRALTNELVTLLSRLGPIGPSHCRYHNKWYRVDDVVNDLRAALEPAPVIRNDRNWSEDAAHGNGNHNCICCQCGAVFVGHKRRVTCRVCALADAGEEG